MSDVKESSVRQLGKKKRKGKKKRRVLIYYNNSQYQRLQKRQLSHLKSPVKNTKKQSKNYKRY